MDLLSTVDLTAAARTIRLSSDNASTQSDTVDVDSIEWCDSRGSQSVVTETGHVILPCGEARVVTGWLEMKEPQ